MNLPVIFDVAIGLVVIYFISSLALSFIIEYVIVRRNWRGDFMYEKLKQMFYNSQGGYYNLIEKVYRHPLVTKLQQYSYRKPENVDSNTFARAFIHVLSEVGEETELEYSILLKDKSQKPILSKEKLDLYNKVKNDHKQIDKIMLAMTNEKYLDGDGKRIVDALFLNKDVEETKEGGLVNLTNIELDYRMRNIEVWYCGFQQRLDYLFKREVKWYLFIYGLGLCTILNIDTLHIYNRLISEEDTRARMVIMGEKFASTHYDTIKQNIDIILSRNFAKMDENLAIEALDSNISKADITHRTNHALNEIQKELNKTTQNMYDDGYDLIGWSSDDLKELIGWFKSKDWSNLLSKLTGVLISAFALMFGAPFWHEYLKSMLAARKALQPTPLIK